MVRNMKKYLSILLALLGVLAAGYTYLVRNVVPGYIKEILPQVEQMAPEYINGAVQIGGLRWGGGLSAELTEVVVKDAQGATVAELPRTLVELRPWLALDKAAKALHRVELVRPKVYLTLDEQEKWNMQNLMKPSDSSETPFYGTLQLDEAELIVTMPEGQWRFGVDGTVNGGANPDFAVDLGLKSGEDELKLTGKMTTKGIGRLQLQGDKLALAEYAALAKHYADIDELQGGLGKLAVLYENKDGEQQRFSGEAELAALSAKKTLGGSQHSLQLDGTVRAHDNYLTLQGLSLLADGQQLYLDAEADLRDQEAPSGFGTLTAPKLAYEGYKLEQLKLPFKADKNEVQLHDVSLCYGGGTITAEGSYELEAQDLVAAVELEQVTQAIPGTEESISLNGRLAVAAKSVMEQLRLHAAAETLELQWRDLTVHKMAVDGSYSSEGLKLDDFSAFVGEEGVIAARGTVGSTGELAIDGSLKDMPIAPLLAAAGQEGNGLVSTGFKVGGTLSAPEFGSMVQLKNAEIMQQHIVDAHGFVGLQAKMLTLKNLVAKLEQGEHIANGTVDLNGTEPLLDLTLETKNVRIEPLMELLGQGGMVTGNLDNVLQLTGTPSHPQVQGEVHAADGSAAKQLYSNVSGRYSYDDGLLQLQDFVVDAFYGRLALEGTMTPDQQLDFELEASNVDLAHLPIDDTTVDLGGLLNTKGHVSGTLTAPFFDGDVSSEKIMVNGEALTELQGTLSSNGKETNKLVASFKQPYRDDPLNYGLFSADVNFNLTEKYVQGKVQNLWADIGGLLRMAKQDYDINGQANGELDFSYQGKGTGVLIKGSAENVKVHDLNYAEVRFEGRLLPGAVLYFDDVRLQEQEGVTDKGIVTVDGWVDLLQGLLDVKLQAVQANAALVTAAMKEPPEIAGETDLLVTVQGSLADPKGVGTLTIANGSIAGVGLDKLTAAMTLADDNIHLQQLEATKDAYGVTASGDIPLDLFRDKAERHNPKAQMNIVVDLDKARLGILPALTKMVEWGIGDTEGKLRLAGTLEEPLVYGSVRIAGGSVKVKDLSTVLDNINLDVMFNGNTVEMKNLSMQLGKGTLVADGSYALRATEDTAYSLHLKADKAQLASQIFTGTLTSDIMITQQRYPDMSKAKGSEPPPLAYRPLIKGSVRLDDVLINMPTLPEMGEGESNYGLDLRVELGPKIHLFNSYLYDLWLSGAIDIKGSTLFPMIDGTIKADKGTITYLRTDFKVNRAGLVWVDPGTFLPNVNLESTARFSRYNIFMKINGPVSDAMELQLTSDPPLEKNTIIRMLTLQRDTAGSNEVTSEDMTNLMSVGLQMTVLGDVEMLVKQTLGLDQFRIYTGKVRSGIGFESAKDRSQELTADEKNQYNVLVSKYLNNNFMIGYTTSFDNVDRSIFGQYDISRHMNLTYSRSYDLSKEVKDWYGLEYKISF